MRILFLNHEFSPQNWEAGNASFYLLREYAKKPELEVDFVTISTDDQYHLLAMGENISIHCLPIGKKQLDINSLTKMEKFHFARQAYRFSLELASKNRYDVSHAFSSFPSGLVALWLKKKIKLPYVISPQKSDVEMLGNKIISFYVFKVWKKASFLVADSRRLGQLLLAASVKREIKIISKGVDAGSFFPDSDKQDAEKFTILCDSQILPIKGIRFLIQAFKILSGRYEKIQLLILGDGNERKSLYDLARSLGVIEKITFLGDVSRENSLGYYQKAHVFASASQDNQVDNGVSIRFALASGLPIVTSQVDGVEDLVVEGWNGYFVGRSVADDFAEKIEILILDKNLRISMGKNSFQLAQDLSWERIATQYEYFYNETVNVAHVQEG